MLVYSLGADGAVLVFLKQKAFYWYNPYSLPRIVTSLKSPNEKKGASNEAKFMNSRTPASCTGEVPQKSNSIVLLYHQPIPFHKHCTFFSQHN